MLEELNSIIKEENMSVVEDVEDGLGVVCQMKMGLPDIDSDASTDEGERDTVRRHFYITLNKLNLYMYMCKH